MIRLSDVVKEYESGTTALKGISLRIEDGEFVFLVGPSGSGKSTIIKLLTGEIVPTSGQIAVNGFSLTNIAERQIPLLRRSVGVIFQDFRLIEKKTVYENLGFAMRAVGSSPREIKKRIPYVLELVGLEEKTDRYPNELSGGEQQRVAIARALINNPSTIIADEPTTALDVTIQAQILDLLRNLQKKLHTATILVSHDLGVVARAADRVAVMYAGKIVEIGTAEEVYYDPRHPYTWALLRALPALATGSDALYTIPGMPPTLIDPPKGDAFACRNEYALAIDYEKEPPLLRVTDTHYAATWLLDPRAPRITPPIGVRRHGI